MELENDLQNISKGATFLGGGGGSGATPDLGHVHTSQNFCLFCKKLRQQKPVSSANDVFHLPKLLMSCHQTSNYAVKNIWRPTIFCQATKSFVPCQLPFVGSSYFANMTTKCSFWLYEKLSFTCVRCEQGCKNEKLVITKFSNFWQTANSSFRRSANRRT